MLTSQLSCLFTAQRTEERTRIVVPQRAIPKKRTRTVDKSKGYRVITFYCGKQLSVPYKSIVAEFRKFGIIDFNEYINVYSKSIDRIIKVTWTSSIQSRIATGSYIPVFPQ